VFDRLPRLLWLIVRSEVLAVHRKPPPTPATSERELWPFCDFSSAGLVGERAQHVSQRALAGRKGSPSLVVLEQRHAFAGTNQPDNQYEPCEHSPHAA
jgi:hypothetical protein